MNSGQRSRIGFIGSIVTHIFILLFVSFVGLFNLSHPPANDIVEVSLFGGGGGGGGNDADIEDSTANDEENSTEADVQEEPTPDPDTIWKNDENKPQPVHKKSAVKKVARKGSGTGQGSGHGSGVGPGTGSGSGGGNGSGHGTGNGSGTGSGSGGGSGGCYGSSGQLLKLVFEQVVCGNTKELTHGHNLLNIRHGSHGLPFRN